MTWQLFLPASNYLPRESTDNETLPSTRWISTGILNKTSTFSEKYNVMLMNFGQFIDHDLTQTPTFSGVECCDGKSMPGQRGRTRRKNFPSLTNNVLF